MQRGWSKELGKWVNKQRQEYKLYTEGKHSQMTEERIRILNEIEFVWDSDDAKWKQRYVSVMVYLSLLFYQVTNPFLRATLIILARTSEL